MPITAQSYTYTCRPIAARENVCSKLLKHVFTYWEFTVSLSVSLSMKCASDDCLETVSAILIAGECVMYSLH